MNDYTIIDDRYKEEPKGYCQCGCGQQTKVSEKSNVGRGYVKGEPRRFVGGHQGRTHVRFVEEHKRQWEAENPVIPYGYCWCGCGQKTELSAVSHRKAGWMRGCPMRYVRNHRGLLAMSRRLAKPDAPGAPTKAFGLDIKELPRETRRRFSERLPRKPAAGCWEWGGARQGTGYGVLWIRLDDGTETHRLAHRLSYAIHKEAIPQGVNVLHSCDNPPCCNPAHLRLGTQRENSADMSLRDRHSGRNHVRNKLTKNDVRKARELYVAGEIGMGRLAKQFGVVRSTMRSIVLRETWKDVR